MNTVATSADSLKVESTTGVTLTLEDLGVLMESLINASVERQEEEAGETPEEENQEDGDNSEMFDSNQLGDIMADPTSPQTMWPDNALLLS